MILNKNNKEKIILITIIAVVVVSVVPLIWISFYNHPAADDYSLAWSTYKCWKDSHSIINLIKGAIGVAVNFWYTWQGTYTTATFAALLPSIFGEQYYAFVGIVMITLIFVSNTVFSVYFVKRFKGKKLWGITIGFLMSFLMVQWMPSAVQGLYWYNGALHYCFPNSLFLIYICLLFEAQRKNSKGKTIILRISCLICAFLIGGGNQVSALMSIVFTTAFVMCHIKKDVVNTVENFGILIATILSFLVSALAPGTAIRQAVFTERPNVLKTIVLATIQGVSEIGAWMDFKTIVALVVVLPILVMMTCNVKKEFGFSFPCPLVVVIGSAAWISIMHCPPFYATGIPGEGRLFNMVYYNFIVLLVINATYIIGYIICRIPEQYWRILKEFDKKWLMTVLLLVVAVLISDGKGSWGYQAIREIYSGRAQQYSIECYERVEMLVNSEGKDVIVKEYSVKPALIFFTDIESDNDNWKNIAVSNYYGLNSITLGD